MNIIPNRKFLSHFLLILSGIILFNISCTKTDETTIILPETGTMTDIDGNEYKTVKIGNQWWMAENLKVIRFRNGASIQEVSDSSDWVNQTTGAYCTFENGNSVLTPPGLLYNWMAVSNPNIIAPLGWHIPSDEEWKQMEKSLGMTQEEADKLTWRGTNEGDKLKTSDQSEWSSFANIFSTNESGFAALAGSCRLFNNQWGDPGLKSTGFWWTSTSRGNEAWYRYLDYKNSNVFRSHVDQHYGFSIRCVKD